MKFEIDNGSVPYVMTAGQDFVSGKMPLTEAQAIYDAGKRRASNRFPGYPVCVDNKYFFAGVSSSEQSKATKSKVGKKVCEKE